MSKYLNPTKAGKLSLRMNYNEYQQFCGLVHVVLENANPATLHDKLAAGVVSELFDKLYGDLGCPLRVQHVRREVNTVQLTVSQSLALFILGNPNNPPGFMRLVLNEIHQKLA